MSYPEDTIDWQLVQLVDQYLDDNVSNQYRGEPLAQSAMRVGKIAEELGEAMSAFIGLTGQNPRKGYTHSTADLLDELADIALTALLAIQHFTKNTSETRGVIRSSMAKLESRLFSDPSNQPMAVNPGAWITAAKRSVPSARAMRRVNEWYARCGWPPRWSDEDISRAAP